MTGRRPVPQWVNSEEYRPEAGPTLGQQKKRRPPAGASFDPRSPSTPRSTLGAPRPEAAGRLLRLGWELGPLLRAQHRPRFRDRPLGEPTSLLELAAEAAEEHRRVGVRAGALVARALAPAVHRAPGHRPPRGHRSRPLHRPPLGGDPGCGERRVPRPLGHAADHPPGVGGRRTRFGVRAEAVPPRDHRRRHARRPEPGRRLRAQPGRRRAAGRRPGAARRRRPLRDRLRPGRTAVARPRRRPHDLLGGDDQPAGDDPHHHRGAGDPRRARVGQRVARVLLRVADLDVLGVLRLVRRPGARR